MGVDVLLQALDRAGAPAVGIDGDDARPAPPSARWRPRSAVGMWVRKRRMASSGCTPMTESTGPHMPASVRKAVPPAQDAFVGGLHVRVAADHGADPAVEDPAHRSLLRGRLAVHVDEDHRRARAQPASMRVDGPEGTIDRVHEHPADQVDDGDLTPPGVWKAAPAARPACRGESSPGAAGAARARCSRRSPSCARCGCRR